MPPKHEGGKEEMGVKKRESAERNGGVRKRLFMRGETRQRVGEAREDGGWIMVEEKVA